MSTTEAEIRDALTAIPAHERKTWLRMGMAIKSALGENGFELWSEWSQTDETYRERDARAVWRSIDAHGGVTIRTLFGEARAHGWRPDEHTAQAATSPQPVRTMRQAEPQDWSDLAESIWRRTQALRRTIGETYLHFRGCVLPPRDSHVRFLPATDKYPPSLCSAVTDIRTGKPSSLHFTRMAPDGHGKAGTDRDKSLLAGHRKRGGCIRVWSDDCVTHGLALAEGIETALAAAHAFTPAWAAIDAGNLAAFPVLAGLESLTVFADHDDAGLAAAAQVGQRWADAGREVLIVTPESPGLDIADIAA